MRHIARGLSDLVRFLSMHAEYSAQSYPINVEEEEQLCARTSFFSFIILKLEPRSRSPSTALDHRVAPRMSSRDPWDGVPGWKRSSLLPASVCLHTSPVHASLSHRDGTCSAVRHGHEHAVPDTTARSMSLSTHRSMPTNAGQACFSTLAVTLLLNTGQGMQYSTDRCMRYSHGQGHAPYTGRDHVSYTGRELATTDTTRPGAYLTTPAASPCLITPTRSMINNRSGMQDRQACRTGPERAELLQACRTAQNVQGCRT